MSQNTPLYTGEQLNMIAYPLGGIGAGMICMEGTGAFSHVSLRHKPDIRRSGDVPWASGVGLNEPQILSALHVKGAASRVLEGPVPRWKIFCQDGAGNGLSGKTYGLPRMKSATFLARFPFATIELRDPKIPLEVTLCAWSPFIPGDADNSSLPVAGLELSFTNASSSTVEAVYSFHARNFMSTGKESSVIRIDKGFVLRQAPLPEKPHDEGYFSVVADSDDVRVNPWFRGAWFDPLTLVWKSIEDGSCVDVAMPTEGDAPPGASLTIPFKLAAGASKTVRILFAWYVPRSDQRYGYPEKKETAAASCSDPGCGCNSRKPATYSPWYATRFPDGSSVLAYWQKNYQDLRARTQKFTDCFYGTTLPAEIIESIAANLTILKSPTVLRQSDGRLWAWEGCGDKNGCCHGTCTHVWNYQQALAHLFPDLERSLRETEFVATQNEAGHQTFRSPLPIGEPDHKFHAAADGQLGGVMKVFREWRISGDAVWMKRMWPAVKTSLEYCIKTWDPGEKGLLEEPHHNTYDIEFWGPDGMCSSFYLGALVAATRMGTALGEDVSRFQKLYEKGRAYLETNLFNGEYFVQEVRWEGLKSPSPVEAASKSMGVNYSKEALELLRREGPKYQYGIGCLADGVLGDWLAAMCGLGGILDEKKIESHLLSVHRHNLRNDLHEHANSQRPGYALGSDGGLVLCTWPRGERLTLPFPYSDEIWTGFEYQVASHLMLSGHVQAGLDILRLIRKRHDGRDRNPFNEYECGHWYARAMSSYGLLQGITGIRYDAVEKTLTMAPQIKGDFRSFLATATGYGLAGIRDGKPFVDVVSGMIEVKKIDFVACASCA
jgi:uncharacterized protein (DUF608 family)